MNDLVLPDGWEYKKLREVVMKAQSGFACNQKFETTEGVVHLRTHNISTNGKLNFDKLVKIQADKIQKGSLRLEAGDLLFNNTNSAELVGKTALIDKGYDYAFSNHITLLKTKPELDSAFLSNYFIYLLNRKFFEGVCNRWIGQAGINTKTLLNIDIPTPPLPTQRRIVAKIDAAFTRLDTAIQLQKQNIARTEEMKKSVLEEVFGELNESNEKTEIRKICTAFNGYAFDSNSFNEVKKGYQVVRIGNVLDLNKNPVYIEPSSQYEKWKLIKGDIIMSLTGTRRKKDYLFSSIVENDNMYLNQRVACFRTNKGYVNKYLYHFFYSEIFRSRIFESETGAVNQGNMSLNAILDFHIPNISLSLQLKIVAKIDNAFAQIDALRTEQTTRLQHLENLKSSILTEAFQGKL